MEDLRSVNKDNASTLEIKKPHLYRELEKRESAFLPIINQISRKVEPVLGEISRVFSSYTLHDIYHSIRIMDYMYELVSDIEKISDLDITILISSAMLHDIGMRVGEEEIEVIENEGTNYSDIKYSAILKKLGDRQEALKDFVRRIHSTRSKVFVEKYLYNDFFIPGLPSVKFTEEIANICYAHTQDISWLKENLKPHAEKGSQNYSPLFCGMLLRMADILDIDSSRTPPFLYNLISPVGFSDKEWLQHFVIHNSDKIKADKENSKRITIYGECDNPEIHRKILSYLDWINIEINNVLQTNELLVNEYKININYPVENHIEPKGYTIADMKLSINFKAISNLLMGERIYGEKKLGLRELIQNSIDACKVRSEIEVRNAKYGNIEYKPAIKIILDKENDKFIVKDNGMGMSLEILKEYFLNVGVSYYKSDDFLLKEYDYTPIGNFGIGFLACFMLSQDVEVNTRHFNSQKQYYLSLSKDSPYICMNENTDITFNGTEIILKYYEVMNLFENDKQKVKNFISKHFLTTGIDVKVIDTESETTQEIVDRINDLTGTDNSSEFINLTDYLDQVEGFIEVGVKKQKHGKSIDDIPYPGHAYLYEDGNLIDLEEIDIDLGGLYRSDSHCIDYLTIPIVSYDMWDEYQKILDVLEDEMETIERLENELEYISIFYSENNSSVTEGLIEMNRNIIGDLCFEDLKKFGQDTSIPTVVDNNKFTLFFSEDRKIFLPFEDERYYRFSILNPNSNVRELYLRNTLVEDFKQEFINKFSFIDVKSMKINVYNNNIITDVSRNRLDKHSAALIGEALNKVMCLWVLDHLDLSEEERKVVVNYIQTFYNQKNILIKKNKILI